MNYQKHYDLLIHRSKNRIIDGYVEKHHIIPKCIGGSDTLSNIAILTPEEHYLAHLLLIKIYPTERKLVFAALMMSVNNKKQGRNNKSYGWVRRKCAEALVGSTHTAETRRKLSELSKGRKQTDEQIKQRVETRMLNSDCWHSDETRHKISLANTGKIHSEKSKKKMSESKLGRVVSVETRRKISKIHKGKIVSSETKELLSQIRKGKSQQILTCPHCNKQGGISNLRRYHFDNCKTITHID